MSVFRTPLASLVNYINTANNMTLNPDDVTFSAPKNSAESWQGTTTGKNTYVKITAKPTATFKGSVVVTYDRLDLADYKKFQPTKPLPAYQKTTTRELASRLLDTFGLNITPEDIVDEPLNLTDGAGRVNLKAEPTSLGWVGAMDIDIVVGAAELNTLATTKDLPGFNYLGVDDPATQTSAQVYMYPYDFTTYRDDLQEYEDGLALTDEQATRLVEILKAVDQGAGAALWNADPASTTWSVAGATCFFNGMNSGAFPTNSKYKYAVGLELRGDVTTPTGRFYLQFSDPVDPNEV